MINKRSLFLISLLFYQISFSPLLWAQDILKDKELEEIIQEATLKLYVNPISVIQVGDSLINNSSDKINEKAIGLLLISDAFIFIRNHPQALYYMNNAKELIGNQLSTNLRIKVLNRLAYQHFQINLFDEALVYLKEAESLNEIDKKAVAYYYNKGFTNVVKGLIYRKMVGCSVAMKYFEKSIEDYSKSGEDLSKMNISIIYYNIGNCYMTMHQFKKAKENYELSFYFADIDSNTKNSLKIFAKKGIANYYYAIGQYSIAIDTLEGLISNAEQIGDKILIRSINSDLVTNYLEIGDWSSYRKYLNKYRQNNKELKEAENNATLFLLNDIQKKHKKDLNLKCRYFSFKIIGIAIFSLLIIVFFYLIIIKKYRDVKIYKSKIYQ